MSCPPLATQLRISVRGMLIITARTTGVNKSAILFHATFWPAAYCVWLVTTTDYHPNGTLRVLCTFLLVGMSALYACCCTPRQRSFRAISISLLALLACGLGAALLIDLVYDWSIGPDPKRFGLARNIAMDTAVVLFNTLCAYVLAMLLESFLGRPLWQLRNTNS